MVELKELKQTWDELGQRDPMWAVLAEPDKKGNRWQTDEFFATGVSEINRLLANGGALGFPKNRLKALDFGCGPGRLTQALATHFDEASGVDIAPSMIQKANSLNRHGAKCKYFVNEASDLRLFPSERFDFIVSMIVLQHVGTEPAKKYIREFVRILAPGGLLVFQVPDSRVQEATVAPQPPLLIDRMHSMTPQFALNIYRAIRRRPKPLPAWEMHGVPRAEVERIANTAGGLILSCIPSDAAGKSWKDFWYYVTR